MEALSVPSISSTPSGGYISISSHYSTDFSVVNAKTMFCPSFALAQQLKPNICRMSCLSIFYNTSVHNLITFLYGIMGKNMLVIWMGICIHCMTSNYVSILIMSVPTDSTYIDSVTTPSWLEGGQHYLLPIILAPSTFIITTLSTFLYSATC